ncbi:MAG TPA: MFS transporter [Planctomycetota bacterium]|nr:MFS transporter [Planctomycetota bacterium]
MEPRTDAVARNVGLVAAHQAVAFGYAVVPFLWFLVAERGLDLAGFAALQSVYYGTTLAAELPTGLLADRIGRRPVLALASISQATGFAVLARTTTFAGFAAAQVLLGLGQAMLSGTVSALLYDSLRAMRRESEYLACESRAIVARLAGTSAAFLLGGALAKHASLAATAWASLAWTALALPIALAMREPRHVGAAPHPLATLRGTIRDVARSADLRWAAALFAVLFVALRAAFHLYGPGFERAGVRDYLSIGVVFAALNVVAAVSTRFAGRAAGAFGERRLLVGCLFALAATFAALAGTSWTPLVLAIFFAQQVPFGLHFPVVASFVNHRAAADRRATTLSLFSLLGRASFALVFPLIGALAEARGLASALAATAALVALPAAVLLKRGLTP